MTEETRRNTALFFVVLCAFVPPWFKKSSIALPAVQECDATNDQSLFHRRCHKKISTLADFAIYRLTISGFMEEKSGAPARNPPPKAPVIFCTWPKKTCFISAQKLVNNRPGIAKKIGILCIALTPNVNEGSKPVDNLCAALWINIVAVRRVCRIWERLHSLTDLGKRTEPIPLQQGCTKSTSP